jgi:hypothetical protein
MTAPYIIPFDNNPVSVSVKTGSYTIPSGQYARVVANVKAGGTFTIDAATALDSVSRSWSVLASDNLKLSTYSTSVGGLATETAQQSMGSAGAAFTETTAYCETSETGEFWLPAGTVINGTGSWRATVMLYNVVS